MLDTQIAPLRISQDAKLHVVITEEAIKRAMERLHVRRIDRLASRLGFSRQTFWRLRRGTYQIPVSKAQSVAQLLDWPLHRVFRQVTSG